MAAAPKKDNTIFRYPYSLVTDNTDYLQIDIVEYKPIRENDQGDTRSTARNLVGQAGSMGSTRKINSGTRRLNTILLPIPSNISDTNATRFGDSELNTIAAAVVGGIQGIMESGKEFTNGAGAGFQAGMDATMGLLSNVFDAAGGMEGGQGFITRMLASKAAGIVGANVSADQILLRANGEMLNPNLELLFAGPTLRSFRFSFKLTPRNTDERDQVLQMIRCLKQSMAPKVKGTTIDGTMIKTPNVFELRYKSGGGDHPFLNHFKQCFLENMTVNYTPDGTYATYRDGTPVSMVLELSFKELEPIYDVDYDTGSSGPLVGGEQAFKNYGVGGVGY